MTIRELYDWAVEQHIEDYNITVAYADEVVFIRVIAI